MIEKIFYFSGTHWDREWYQTFQGFRLKLISVMDDLINDLEKNPELKVFHMDGQTIVLDDYIEVRKDMRERLAALIRSGRIVIGPWYCMPDENLVSGEAIIRNFEKGFARCHDWGAEPWKVGYICDIFGHTPQMPQIFNGFGIKTAVLGRGTNNSDTPLAFIWESQGGSRVTTLRVPDKSGYGSFAMEVSGQKPKGEAVDPETPEFMERLKEYMDHEVSRTNVPCVVIWDAMDHEPMHELIPKYVASMAKAYPHCEVEQVELSEVFRFIEPYQSEMPIKQGELYTTAKDPGPYLHLLTHVLSSRQSVKDRNDRCQSLLESTLEPACAYFFLKGISFPDRILDIAWESLLQNHPHDSICGCSVDRVHFEMDYRFSQVESISEAVIEEGIRKLSKGAFCISGMNDKLVILSPSPMADRACLELDVPFSVDYPHWSEPFGYQDICAFRLMDADGNDMPYAIKSITTGYMVRTASELVERVDMYKLMIPMQLGGFGAKTLRVIPSGKPVRDMERIAGNGLTLENEYLTVKTNPDGTVDITDKTTGTTYCNQLQLVDTGEIGDGWNSVAPVSGIVSLHGTVKRMEVIHNSGIMGTIRISKEYELPTCMEYAVSGTRRSDTYISLPCTFEISLAAGERGLRARLSIDNRAKDHVLRLRIPTGIVGGEYEANSMFTFVKRTAGVNKQTHDWKESDKLEKPMAGIVLKRDKDGNGIAFLSKSGLHECGADDDTDGSLYVTLLRCFSKTYTTNGEPGGQELFEHTYDFELAPLDATVTNCVLQNRQRIMQTTYTGFVCAEAVDERYLTVDGEVCVSALRTAGDRIMLRLYNPDGGEHIAWIKADAQGIFTTDLKGDIVGKLARADGIAQVTLLPYEIKTLILDMPV